MKTEPKHLSNNRYTPEWLRFAKHVFAILNVHNEVGSKSFVIVLFLCNHETANVTSH